MDTVLSGNESVDQMIGVDITGNIIPPVWFNTILKPSTQKPYFLAILLLSDIVYWFRPIEYRDESTGKTCGYKSKLHGRYLTKTYNAYAEYFGVSKREIKAALDYLNDDLHVIKRIFELVGGDAGSNEAKVYTGRIFIDLDVEVLKQLTFITENPDESYDGAEISGENAGAVQENAGAVHENAGVVHKNAGVVHKDVGVVHKNVGGWYADLQEGGTQKCRGGTRKRKDKETINNKRLYKENNIENNLSYLSYQDKADQDDNRSDVIEDISDRQVVEGIIRHNISYDDCINDPSILNYGDIELFKELYQIIVDTATSNGKTIVIAGDRKPVRVVRERYMQLTLSDLEYVMQALSEQTGEIRNIRNYLQTALFNARTTINHFFARKVAHDFNNSG